MLKLHLPSGPCELETFVPPRFKKWAMVVMSRGETVNLPDRDNKSTAAATEIDSGYFFGSSFELIHPQSDTVKPDLASAATSRLLRKSGLGSLHL